MKKESYGCAVVLSLTVGDGWLCTCDAERVTVRPIQVAGNDRVICAVIVDAIAAALKKGALVTLRFTTTLEITTIGTTLALEITTPTTAPCTTTIGRTCSNITNDCRGVVRTRPRDALVETTSHLVVAIGDSPGRRLVPHGMLVALLDVRLTVQVLLLEAGTDRYVTAGRGLAAARRIEQAEYDGRGVESHDNTDTVLLVRTRCYRRADR